MNSNRRIALTAATVAGLTSLIVGTASATTNGAADPHRPKPTIVLVHGAWADGSSWAAVTERLQHEGYTVDVPPNTLRGVATDSANLRAFLQTVKGPIVLVGHSYGGVVISNAATGNMNIKSLVYVDAYIPDKGETLGGLTAAQPGSGLAIPDPSTVFNAVPIPDGGGNVDLYVKQNLYPQIFAAGINPNKAAVLAAGQRPLAASTLAEPSGTPAWKTVPSWALIGTADKVLPPAEQKTMTVRAHSHTIQINAPHLSMVAKPDAITALINDAAHH
ncbi:alpha/beta hydrolase [Streptomyces mirabilis]|uniref:alpha/beta fold hydrolase n=1 Tax=Streptomyces mirabilis TaxID=68239 RepID=UPI0021C18484|nr:alpha/beta hydrolase [Streptomyces mirabilis]MCT9114093.1 alpha/beta hydrolase [Streptomyces mirabilis]